jgi:hypothetical protein
MSVNRLTKLMQDHETQLVQGQLDLKYLESSAAVFSQYQELCRRAAEKEADLASRLVAIQALLNCSMLALLNASMLL